MNASRAPCSMPTRSSAMPPPRAARGRRPRSGRAQAGAGAGGRRYGGLGAPVLLYLAAAGVGTLGMVDDDAVSLSNLQRQVIHATGDVGRPKVESAGQRSAASIPMCASKAPRGAAHGGERARHRLALRSASPMAPTTSPPLSRGRRLLSCRKAPGDCRGRRVRRDADDDPRPREGPRRHAFPTYRCLFRSAAARNRAGLCGSRHPRRPHRRGRLADGAGGDPRNRRLRRRPGRPAADDRREGDAVPGR